MASVLVLLGLAAWRPGSDAPVPPPASPATAAISAATATTPPAAADTVGAHLRLDIAPWGVVYVDGQMKGLTPPLKQLWLQPGQHTIEVRNTGLPSHTETITIEAGKDVQLRHQFE